MWNVRKWYIYINRGIWLQSFLTCRVIGRKLIHFWLTIFHEFILGKSQWFLESWDRVFSCSCDHNLYISEISCEFSVWFFRGHIDTNKQNKKVVETKWGWWNQNWFIRSKFPLLRIPKIIFFWLEYYLVMKNC